MLGAPAEFPTDGLDPLTESNIAALVSLEKRMARHCKGALTAEPDRSFADWLASWDDEATAAAADKANRTLLSWEQTDAEKQAAVNRNDRLHGARAPTTSPTSQATGLATHARVPA